MSQSMIRSKKFELGADCKRFQRKASKEQSPLLKSNPLLIKDRFGKHLETLENIEKQNRKKSGRILKYPNSEDYSLPLHNVKNSIQGIITPVVQISYNQIKSDRGIWDSSEKSKNSSQLLYSQRANRIDILQTVNSLNRALSRKANSEIRTRSLDRSLNKGSFISNKEAKFDQTLKVTSIKPNETSTSFQHNPNIDYYEEEIDERSPGETILKNRANSINESIQYNKRSMSEMQKEIKPTISISKAPPVPNNRFKDKNKNQILTTLNGIKTVSLNDLTGSTKSGGQNSSRGIKGANNTLLSSYSGSQFKLNIENNTGSYEISS